MSTKRNCHEYNVNLLTHMHNMMNFVVSSILFWQEQKVEISIPTHCSETNVLTTNKKSHKKNKCFFSCPSLLIFLTYYHQI